MSRSLALFAIGVVFGGIAGFVVAAGNEITLSGHDHSDPAHHGPANKTKMAIHDHAKTLPIADPAHAPRLEVSVTNDPHGGWNLHLKTSNFRFAPEKASKANVDGEGHAHLYANGEKLARVYGHWFHIAKLPKGTNTLTVTLNSNDHRALTVGGRIIEKTITVTVP